jgi:cysteine desulfurase
MRRIYLDHNATTPMLPAVREHFLARLDEGLGNASSVHASGRRARAHLDDARERTAAALAVHEDEIVFTSGGTESIHLAILGHLRAATPGAALVTSAIEHSAVLGAADRAQAEGRPVVRVGVDACGRLDVDELEARVRARETGLISIQAANNEIGVVPPIAAIGDRLRALGPARPRLHTDAVQALGRVPLALREWGVDFASLSGHKVGGPLGVGVLVRRRAVPVLPLVSGGGQESELRAGTENVAAISATALAIELAVREGATRATRLLDLCRSFWTQLQSEVPGVVLHGPPIDAHDRLPNTLNVGLPGFDGRVLVARLDLEGLEVSAGSACASGSLEPSHVLRALGLDDERARAGVRISLGTTTSAEDLHIAVEILRRTFRGPR